MKTDKDMENELYSDLSTLEDYLVEHKLESYMLIAVSDSHNYFYTWNFKEMPDLVISKGEQTLHELKTKLLAALENADTDNKRKLN